MPLRLDSRARVIVGVLALIIVVDLIAIAAQVSQLALLDRIFDGERVGLEEIRDNDDRVHAIGIAQFILFVLGAVAWLVWQSLAYRNVLAMGAKGERFSTKWAIGWWFVPLANLFQPKRVMNDIYRGSDPDMPAEDYKFTSRRVDPLLHLWWAVWLASYVIDRIARGRADDPLDSTEEVRSAAKAFLISDIGDAIAAALAILVVLQITRRVVERRRRFDSDALQQPGERPHEPAAPGESPGGSVAPPEQPG